MIVVVFKVVEYEVGVVGNFYICFVGVVMYGSEKYVYEFECFGWVVD